MSEEKTADIYLLGSGTFSFLDITLLTQHILVEQCKTLYFLHDLPSLEKFLKKLVPNAENLLPIYYGEGKERFEIYKNIVSHVIETDERKRPVALLLHGHPLVCSTLSRLLIQECENRGLALEIVPAVSSLDRMFVDLKLDIFEYGVQILVAAAVVGQNIPLNPRLGCLLFQIGSLNTVAARLASAKTEEVSQLRDYLLKFYPGHHMVKIVESAVEIGFESRVVEIPLENLMKVCKFFNYNASMYVPPLPTSPKL